MSETSVYQNILVERRGGVGIVTLNRPQALNALNAALISELGSALDMFEADDAIGAIILTGNDKAFAAGADVKEMAGKTYPEIYLEDFITRGWERVGQCRKPVIAAVAGFALGGGCEIAMMCDIVIAADTARFGQPEIQLGTMPGAGGTQRLSRFVGKAKAMDLCLTGRMMDAAEAERAGLVSRIVPAADLLGEAIKVAERIAQMSRPIAMMVKELVNRAYETTLAEGVRFERRLFHSTFATEDRKEGMAAFIEKRKASLPQPLTRPGEIRAGASCPLCRRRRGHCRKTVVKGGGAAGYRIRRARQQAFCRAGSAGSAWHARRCRACGSPFPRDLAASRPQRATSPQTT